MTDQRDRDRKNGDEEISRRDFLRVTGVVIVGAGMGVGLGACGTSDTSEVDHPTVAIPVSEGYLLVDTKKCQGCISCMLACSLVHEGRASLSLARIQIIQSSFEKWPEDLIIEQCRQCVEPACVTACPTGALAADPVHKHVRRVDMERCVGCRNCVRACPYIPSRPIVAPDERYGDENKARKCDLCAYAPYHWDEAGGGPDGKQACVEVCPVGAIAFTKEIPEQEGDAGYLVNLRDRDWAMLGYPTDDGYDQVQG